MRELVFVLQTCALNVGSLFYVCVSAQFYCNIGMSSTVVVVELCILFDRALNPCLKRSELQYLELVRIRSFSDGLHNT